MSQNASQQSSQQTSQQSSQQGSQRNEIQLGAEEVRFTAQGKLLLVAVLFLYAQAYALNNLSPALLATLLFAYIAYSRLSFNAQLGETNLVIQRHATDRAFHGKAFPAQVEIYNRSRQAVWLGAEDILPEEVRVASGEAKMVRVIEPDSSSTMDYMLLPLTRVRLMLDRLKLRLMDERGLMEIRQEASSPKEVEIEPALETFHAGEILYARDYPTQLSTSPSRRLGRGYEFAGIRQYSPDDAFVTIEWKASSRLAKLMTKLMHEETRSTVCIFLDCSTSMRMIRRRSEKSKLDNSLELAVRLITHLARQGNPVALAFYDEHRVLGFEPPRTGRMKPADLLTILSNIPGSRTTASKRMVARTGRRDQAQEDEFEEDVGGEGFLARILPFLGRRNVTKASKATGIYHAVERLADNRIKSATVIIFSDLQTAPRSMMISARALIGRGHRPMVITPFAPGAGFTKEELTTQVLGQLYAAYQDKKALMHRLEMMGVQVIEVEEGKKAAIEISRRLARGVRGVRGAQGAEGRASIGSAAGTGSIGSIRSTGSIESSGRGES